MIGRLTRETQANAPRKAATLANRRARALRSIVLALPFALTACAVKEEPVEQSFDPGRAAILFTAGYQDITEMYIESKPLSELAVAGLDSLATIDPAFEAERQGGYLQLSLAGKARAEIAFPKGESADEWGRFTASAVGAAKRLSPKLESAEPEVLYEAVFDGALSQLDGYSRYAGREEAREQRASRDGFGGIGVTIKATDEGVQITSVMEKTPAESAGLLGGDLITAIDSESVFGLSQRDVVKRLRGPSYSKVVLTVRRKDVADPLSIAVTRAHIVPQTVRYEPRGNSALIRLSSFNQDTTRSLREKLEQAREEMGPRLDGVILDLRGNPGGLLDQAVAVSDALITAGPIVSTHGRHFDSHQFFKAGSDDVAPGLPVVVLVDGGSASAAEIVAAALQDSGRAVVIGTNSFGKGTVQTVLRLPNDGEMTLTWARFHAPSGYTIDHRGVLPDICTSANDGDIEHMLEAVRAGQAAVNRYERSRIIDIKDDAALSALRGRCPANMNDEREFEVELALRLLADPALFARALGNAVHAGAWPAAQVSGAQGATAD